MVAVGIAVKAAALDIEDEIVVSLVDRLPHGVVELAHCAEFIVLDHGKRPWVVEIV